MSALAAIRPDDWNLPLFLHVLGAMVLVGALVLVVASLAGAGRVGSGPALRLGYRALLLAVLPAWLVMRIAAEWVASEENAGDLGQSWVDIGYSTSEGSLLLLIAATVCAGIAWRRVDRGKGEGPGLARAATILVALAIVVYVVAIWAMTTKPA
jgi:hypothetical protein